MVVALYSFNAARYGGLERLHDRVVRRAARQSREARCAAKNTLVLAIASTVVATVLGTLLGYGLSRYDFPGKKLFSWLMYIPVVIPDIVMAVAMLLFFALRARAGSGSSSSA